MLLELDDRAEVRQSLLPLLLKNVDLTASDVCFDVARVAHQSLGESAQSTLVIVDPTICDRKDNKHGFAVVRTLLN